MDLNLSAHGEWPSRRPSLPSELAEALAMRIREGELAPGSRLPSEPSLAKMLNVSRNTVREAISVLREQGLVVTHQGLGTFALDPNDGSPWPVDIGIEHLSSSTELITRAGRTPGSRDYTLSVVRGGSLPAKRFQLAAEDKLHCIERVRTADDLPVILCRDYIRTEAVPSEMMNRYDGNDSLFDFLNSEVGLRVRAARADIVPMLPSQRIADLLQVSRRKPLLVLYQVHYDADGVPFLYSENHFNPEYMGVHVRRTTSP